MTTSMLDNLKFQTRHKMAGANLLNTPVPLNPLNSNPQFANPVVVNPVVDGSSWQAIWHLSWPMVLNMLVIASANLVEGWVAGRLGADVQAGVGIASQIWFFMLMITLALAAGTTALVSRFFGAGDYVSAAQAARQAILLSCLFGALAGLVEFVTCRPLLHIFGAPPAVEEQGWNYLKYGIISMVPYSMLWISNSVFRASGDGRTPMYTMVLVTALIIILDLVLCLAANLGIAGVGIAWTVASTTGAIINLKQLKKTKLASCLNLRTIIREGISVTWMVRLLKIGLPACVQDISLLTSSLGLFLILAQTQNPTVSQAAWAGGMRIEEVLTIMPMYGLNMAAATIVGQNLGALKAHKAKLEGWQITALGVLLNVVVALTLYFGAGNIACLMSNDRLVIAACIDYLHVMCWTEPFFAAWLILSGAMQGAGYTKWPMVSAICSFDLLRLSLAWIFSVVFAMGLQSIWISMAVSTVVATLIAVWQWKSGKWQSQLL